MLLDEILFSECLGCREVITFNKCICDDCLQSIVAVSTACRNCGAPLQVNADMCRYCIDQPSYDYLYCAYWYKGAVRSLLKEIKFRYHLKGLILFQDLVKPKIGLIEAYDMILPVPSFWSRRFRRFVHPADVMVNSISKHHQVPLFKGLKRTRKTEYQWKMDKKKRYRNIKGAFVCNEQVSKLKILLVDDIITTGATLNECARVLKEAGAIKVDCFTFARGVYR